MGTKTLTLTIDTDDLSATLSYIVRAVAGWSDAKLEALALDVDPLIASGSAVDMDTAGKHATVGISASAAFLDVLRKHGLDGRA